MLPSIIAFDPGGTTGYLYRGPKGTIETGELKGDHHIALWALLVKCLDEVKKRDKDAKLVVVFEDFLFLKSEKEREKIAYTSKEYIGIIKMFCQTYNHDTQLRTHSSAQRGQFWDDVKLRQVGLWNSKSKHIRDAAKHYLYYVSFTLKDNRYIHMLPKPK